MRRREDHRLPLERDLRVRAGAQGDRADAREARLPCLRIGCADRRVPESDGSRTAGTWPLLAHILVSKHGDALPLYRKSQIYDRYGMHRPDATLGDGVRLPSM